MYVCVRKRLKISFTNVTHDSRRSVYLSTLAKKKKKIDNIYDNIGISSIYRIRNRHQGKTITIYF